MTLGEFKRLLTRIQVVVAEPMRVLATILLISAVFYGAVALTGRKPEWHTLLEHLRLCQLCRSTGIADAAWC